MLLRAPPTPGREHQPRGRQHGCTQLPLAFGTRACDRGHQSAHGLPPVWQRAVLTRNACRKKTVVQMRSRTHTSDRTPTFRGPPAYAPYPLPAPRPPPAPPCRRPPPRAPLSLPPSRTRPPPSSLWARSPRRARRSLPRGQHRSGARRRRRRAPGIPAGSGAPGRAWDRGQSPPPHAEAPRAAAPRQERGSGPRGCARPGDFVYRCPPQLRRGLPSLRGRQPEQGN